MITPLAENYKERASEQVFLDRYASLPVNRVRQQAFEAFMRSGLPHRRMEDWKWTDFKVAFDRLSSSGQDPVGSRQALPVTPDAVVLRLTSGGPELPASLPRGLALRVRQQVAPPMIAKPDDMPLVALTMALNGQSAEGGNDLVLDVTERISKPLHIVFSGNGNALNLARLTINLAPGASLDLVESHLGGADFSSFMMEIQVGANADLRRTLLQRGGRDEIQAITVLAMLGRACRYQQTSLAFGAKLARIETHLTHDETTSLAEVNAAYLCGHGYHADMTSHVHHDGPACVTKQTTKGAVLKGGTGVFQGTFHVPPMIGQHTNASMRHHALMLEKGAKIFARPELEIHADDVECSHSNTSGTLDDDQLFYLRQRGIALVAAKAMLTEGFIRNALDMAFAPVRASLFESVRIFLEKGK